jgi:hypothetical protein
MAIFYFRRKLRRQTAERTRRSDQCQRILAVETASG